MNEGNISVPKTNVEYPLLLASTLTANGDSTFVCSLKQEERGVSAQ